MFNDFIAGVSFPHYLVHLFLHPQLQFQSQRHHTVVLRNFLLSLIQLLMAIKNAGPRE